jgi:hypothetical protein
MIVLVDVAFDLPHLKQSSGFRMLLTLSEGSGDPNGYLSNESL